MRTAGYADWLGGATFSAFTYPVLVVGVIAIIDFIEWLEGSRLVPFTSFLMYGLIWMLVSVVCCYHGAIMGYKESSWVKKHKPNPVKRKVPE